MRRLTSVSLAMFNSNLDLPVPVTARPIGMRGGGASSSKDGLSPESHHPRGTQNHHTFRSSSASLNTATAASSAASPPPAGYSTSSSAAFSAAARGPFPIASPSTPLPNGLGGSMRMISSTTGSTAGDGCPVPMQRPTITIFTEFDDEDGGDDAAQPWMSGTNYLLHTSTGYRDPSAELHGTGLGARQASALAQTETTLSPLHYQSLCTRPTNDDNVGMATSFFDHPVAGPTYSSSQPPTTVTEGSGEERNSTSSAVVTSNSSNGMVSSTTSHGPQQANTSFSKLDDSTPSDQHPVRLSATPVVPIAPYVAEPSCRRRVAEDLERLYGSNSRQPSANAASLKPTNTAAAPQAAAAAAAAGGESHDAARSPTPPPLPETPKKKRSSTSFFSSSSSSKKAAKAAKEAEAKKKTAAPPTAAERRQSREQVIRVGVQRLHQRLNELHLVAYHVKNDGNCQFRAISHQLFGNEDYHDIIRSQVVSYMRAARAECFDFYFESPAQADAYYDNLAKPGSWGDELSLRAASDCLYVNIHVLSSEERNCYITYRPAMDRAAFAPSFLIDIAKLRERRRAERLLLLRSHGLQDGASSSMASFDIVSPGLGSSHAGRGGDCSGFGTVSTMPDLYGRCRAASAIAPPTTITTTTTTATTAANLSAPTLLTPIKEDGTSSAGQRDHSSSSNGGVAARLCPKLQPMSRVASTFIEEDDDNDAEMDANAIQLALHKKLQQSEIRCSLPLGVQPCNSYSFGPGVGMGGAHGLGPTSMPLLQPQRTALTNQVNTTYANDGSALLLRPVAAAVPVPRLVSGDEDVMQGPRANQMERFRAVGAEVQPLGDATQAVNIFTQQMESAPVGAVDHSVDHMELRQAADNTKADASPAPAAASTPAMASTAQASRRTLLRPQKIAVFADGGSSFSHQRLEPLAMASSVPFTPSPLTRPSEEPVEMMLLASSIHRGGGRCNSSLHQSFSNVQTVNSYGGYNGGCGGSMYAAESFNPMQGSFSQSFTGGACAQSLGNLVPVSTHDNGSFMGCSSTDPCHAHSGDSGSPISYFKFEPRTEPIDIFLSYLYPVHYNSLSVAQQQQ